MATTDSITLPISEQPDNENWRDIPAHLLEGRWALNRVIGRRLGYYVVVRMENKVEQYQLIAPHERAYTHEDYAYLQRMGGDYAKRISANAAWRDGHDYTEDANAALDLPIGDSYLFITKADGKWIARIVDPEGKTVDDCQMWKADAKTPALAICLAWLAYTDAQARRDNTEVNNVD